VLRRHGLCFHTLVESWVRERIVPLAPRPWLLFNYSGRTDDSLRSYNKAWTKVNFIAVMKKLIHDNITDLEVMGYPPF
jgi:hypothetical protein